MKKMTILLSLFVFCGIFTLQAQNVQISGTVTSAEDGLSLPGVSVVVTGTTIGTVTDFEGRYSFNVPSNAQSLTFSFVGMATETVAIQGRSVIDIAMVPDLFAIDELVVTALGISRERKTLGYSVQQIGGDELNQVRQTDALSALQGRVAGAQIKSSSNMGGSNQILVRGASSMLGDNSPLIIVDGVPMDNQNFNTTGTQTGGGGIDYGNMMNDINPGEIENISVLKGAAAALYGSRAANGVILITTKSARQGRESFSVDVNSSVDFQQLAVIPKMQVKYGGGTIISDANGGVNGFNPVVIDGTTYLTPAYAVDESWGPRFDPNIQVVHFWGAEDYAKGITSVPETAPWVAPENDIESFWNLGRTLNNSVGVSKTGESYGIRFSYANSMTEGTMPGSEMNQNSFKLASDASISDKITVNSNLNFSSNYAKGRPTLGYTGNSVGQQFFQWGQRGLDHSKLSNYKNVDGTQRVWNRQSFENSSPKYADNPYWTANENYSEDQRTRFFGNLSLNYQITDELSFNGGIYGDSYNFFIRERTALGSKEQSEYHESVRSNTEFNYEARLNYNKQFDGGIDFSGLAGVNRRDVRYDRNSGTTSGGMVVPGLFTLSNSNDNPSIGDFTSERRVNSAFGQVALGYQGFLNVDLSVRNDWSSTLPEDNNSYFYYGVAGSFVLTELVEIPVFNLAKLRAGYSQVGNDTDPYRVISTYNYNANGPFGTAPRLSVATSMANPDLKAETTTTTEVGIDLIAFQNRADLSVTYFNKATTDLIMPLQTSRATGYMSKIINAGNLSSKGWEISLGLTPVQTNDFAWHIRSNFTMSKMVVEELFGDIQTLDIGTAPFGGVTLRASIGDEYGQLWGYDYLYDDNGSKVVSAGGAWMRTPNLVPLGSVYPDFNLGIGNNFTYKDFDLGFLVDIQQGGIFYSLTHQWGMYSGMFEETAGVNDKGNEIRDPVTEGGGIRLDGVTGTVTYNEDGTYNVTDTAPNELYVSGIGWAARHYYGYGTPSAQSVFKADYIKLREVTLGYTFRRPLFNEAVKQLRIAAYGRNIFTWGLDQPGFDPEMTVAGSGNIQGMEGGLQPTFRSFGMNLVLNF